MSVGRVLCVDDEPHVLAGLERNLRRLCPIVTAVGGPAALALLRRDRDFAVIVSDMRMPEMTGAEFLREARLMAPTSVRILLTGEADLDAVVSAVNDGHIHHYLRKPVEREALHSMVQRGFLEHQHAMEASGRAWTTARGGAGLSLEMLRAFAPEAAAHAHRASELALTLAEHIGLTSLPAVELTAWLAVVCKRLPPGEGRKWVEQLITDDGVLHAIDELTASAPSGVLARVVGAALLHDELSHAQISAEERNRLLERSVDARTLEALSAVARRAA